MPGFDPTQPSQHTGGNFTVFYLMSGATFALQLDTVVIRGPTTTNYLTPAPRVVAGIPQWVEVLGTGLAVGLPTDTMAVMTTADYRLAPGFNASQLSMAQSLTGNSTATNYTTTFLLGGIYGVCCTAPAFAFYLWLGGFLLPSHAPVPFLFPL